VALDWDAMAVVARVARTHGLRGQVIVNPETDFIAERFRQGEVLYGQRQGTPQALTVTAVRIHRGRPILTFESIASIADAQWLSGTELRVPAEALQRLPVGEFYHHDLVGCRVRTAGGQEVGTVVAVEGPREGSRLVVRGGGRDVLVPLAAEICVEIDAERRRIVIEPPEGLLDLNP
jgi:16S rRNA processing protein RimM